ncbi:MAG: ACT domain-containing protein [Candidatus Omnitrophica bacterium]|nr:ACT domain-containing protein [Candidatus Omnitrophota bacterium]
MNISLVMTIIGPDRPGLVDSVATIVAEHGGNWLESRMSRLGGQFAGILRIQLPSDNEAALGQALRQLESLGITAVVLADQPPGTATPKRLTRIEIVGQDRPGIVRQISHALARHGVNVEELNTECQSAPMSGETLFKAQAKLQIPAACNLADLTMDLEKIAADLMVDLSWSELPVSAPPA